MRPDVVDRLIVMNCPHLERFSNALRRNPRQMLRSWYMLFFQIPRIPEWVFRRRNYKALLDALRDSTFQKNVFTDDDLEILPRRVPQSIFDFRRDQLLSRECPHRLHGKARHRPWIDRKISAPTLLIWGEQDFALGKELTYGMEPLFTGPFEIKYIPDSGHWVQQEKPGLVNQYVRDFLDSHAPA